MLFYINLGLIIYFLTKKQRRLNNFILTLVISLFLFSSQDPFFGIPIYFYNMLISIILCFDGKSSLKNKRNLSLLFLLLIIITLMLFQIFNICIGENILPSILINETSTDYMDITTHLKVPTLNFTIFKHFVFYILYLIFIICNSDLLNDSYSLTLCKNKIFKIFKFMFICIIIEWLIVNLLNGYNDRPIMDFLFNLDSRMDYNWNFMGYSSVCFWFTERSYIDCILVFYLLLTLSKNKSFNSCFWFIISGITVFCVGSSTGIFIFLIFLLYFTIEFLLKSNNIFIKFFFIILDIIIICIVLSNHDILKKIQDYLFFEESYGSAYFRRQANNYGLEAIKFSPFLGIGIGTIYCHSLLIQTIANIGFLGFMFAIVFHVIAIKKVKFNFNLFIKIFIVALICSSAYMIQEFTSPYILCIFIPLLSNNL